MDEVLIIEERGNVASLLLGMAEENSWRIEAVRDAEQAEAWLHRRFFHVVALELKPGDGAGESLLARVKQQSPQTQCIVITPEQDAQRGFRALKLGAYDSLRVPVERAGLEISLRRAVERARLGVDLRSARLREERRPQFLGDSAAMTHHKETLLKAAGQEVNLLLLGEDGSGKQTAAGFIHYHGTRRKGPLVVFEGAGLGPDRERELFGGPHEPGALELAAGGVLVLRHVEGLASTGQARLLRALQDRGYTPEGATRFVPLDARVVATAPPSLPMAIKRGKFREDLYWSLGGAPLEVPPLRARAGDAAVLFKYFLERRCARLGRATPQVRPEVEEALRVHPFPGNVGELKSMAELAADLGQEDVGLSELPVAVTVSEQEGPGERSLKDKVHAFERQMILRTLRAVRGNQSRAAERLVVHRNTLILKMQELDIPNKRTLKTRRIAAPEASSAAQG